MLAFAAASVAILLFAATESTVTIFLSLLDFQGRSLIGFSMSNLVKLEPRAIVVFKKQYN